MIKFDNSFFEPASYLGNRPALNARGTPQNAFPTPVTVYASVQSRRIERLEASGEVKSRTAYSVYLRDDPSALNGGLGVLVDDAFELPTGEFAQAQDRPARQSLGPGCTLWLVECLDMA